MTKIKLTQTFIDKLNAPTKDHIYWDTLTPCFALKITKNNHKSYIMQTRIDGREYKRTLFKADRVKLDRARKEATIILGKIANGINPFEQNKTEIKNLNDFSQIFIEEYVKKHKKPSSIIGDQSLLRNHILPCLGKLHPDAITRRQIKQLKEAVESGKTAKKAITLGICKHNSLKGGKICANRCLALLSKLFNFGIVESYLARPDNPVKGIRKNTENVKEVYLNNGQLLSLAAAIKQARKDKISNRKAILAIELIAHTGARRSEITELLWTEVDLENQIIRKIDTKTGARDIPLSERAIAMLTLLRKRKRPSHCFVFSNSRDMPVCIRKPWHRIRKAAGLSEEVTIHTLRHTFASHAAKSGKNAFQIAKILGHRSLETTKRYVKIGNDTAKTDVDDIVKGMFKN